MSEDLYSRLAAALDRLPGRFPCTPSGTEVPLLQHLFSTAQAELGAVMGRDYEDVELIASRVGRPFRGVGVELARMAERGLVLGRERDDRPTYRLRQFLDGILERNIDRMGPELAHLYEAYMDDGGARLLMGDPAYARVLPGEKAIRSDWILPYDDVRSILEQTTSIVVGDCFCRKERALAGAPCRYPLNVCLNLRGAQTTDARTISTADALRLLDEAEEAGLVHTVTNVCGGWDWLCNCCSCCCMWLRGFTEWQIDTAVVSNYRVTIEASSCSGCGVCEERCPVAAISVADERARPRRESCIGCGLCVTSCPTSSLQLERLPEAAIILPPSDHEAWEDERLRGQ